VGDAHGVRENASRGHGCCVVSQFQRRFRVCCILFAVGDRWGAKREAKKLGQGSMGPRIMITVQANEDP
jgi:hypothetical protein